jgi:alkylation response protein AidB-like acyl-CoA dehydrogenase
MIDMQTTEDQEEIIEAVSLFLIERLPVSRHRKAELGGRMEPGMLKEIAGLGWIGLGVPEETGGHGRTLIDDMLLSREFGRYLAPMSLFASVLAARLAAGAGRTDLAKLFIAGESKVAIAIRCDDPRLADALLIVDAPDAEWVVGLTAESAYLMSCADLPPPELLQPTDASIDLARRNTIVGATIVSGGKAAFIESLLLGSAVLVGMAEATRDMAVAYAKNREQFGQPIGAFQAIKHMCADMALRSEAAKCLLFFAAIEVEGENSPAPMHVAAAKVMAADASMLNAYANIQVHGGTGFTVESDAHLYVKRTHVLEQILGPQRWHQSLLGKGKALLQP